MIEGVVTTVLAAALQMQPADQAAAPIGATSPATVMIERADCEPSATRSCSLPAIVVANGGDGLCVADFMPVDRFVLPGGRETFGYLVPVAATVAGAETQLAEAWDAAQPDMGLATRYREGGNIVNLLVELADGAPQTVCVPTQIERDGQEIAIAGSDVLRDEENAEEIRYSMAELARAVGGRRRAPRPSVIDRITSGVADGVASVARSTANYLFGESVDSLIAVEIISVPSNLPVLLDDDRRGFTNFQFQIAERAISRLTIQAPGRMIRVADCGFADTVRRVFRC